MGARTEESVSALRATDSDISCCSGFRAVSSPNRLSSMLSVCSRFSAPTQGSKLRNPLPPSINTCKWTKLRTRHDSWARAAAHCNIPAHALLQSFQIFQRIMVCFQLAQLGKAHNVLQAVDAVK